MKKVPVVVALVSLYAFVFQLSPYIGFSDAAILLMFAFSPILVIYMVYTILKHGKPSEYTFDEKFYDDLDYFRNGKEEKE
jgi:hypothetical protein